MLYFNEMLANKVFPKSFLIIMLVCLTTGKAFSQDMDYARKVIKTLSSPAFRGRGYVKNGDKIAAAFIAKEFKKSGLLPLNKGSYFQDFSFPVNTFPGRLSVKLNHIKLIPGVNYLVDASSPGSQGTFKVIAVAREDINTPEKFRALTDRSVNSFILLDNTGSETESVAAQRVISANVRLLRTSEKLSFRGLVLLSKDKLTWTTLTYQNPRPVIHVNKAGLVAKAIESITVEVENKFIPKYTSQNVTGMIKGTSGSDSTLVITAHFDHLGMMGKNTYFPGANDNASGTSMLLNFVRHYAVNKPKYNTVFIAFSGEEIGLLGSKAFVTNPLIDLSKIKFLINFDLAGTGDEGVKVVNGTKFKVEFDQLVWLNAEYKLVPKVELRGESCNSDHCPFYENGVPSFFIYTQGGIQAYHDIYDKAETLPLTAYAGYFKLMTKFLNKL